MMMNQLMFHDVSIDFSHHAQTGPNQLADSIYGVSMQTRAFKCCLNRWHVQPASACCIPRLDGQKREEAKLEAPFFSTASLVVSNQVMAKNEVLESYSLLKVCRISTLDPAFLVCG